MSAPILQDAQAVNVRYVPIGHAAPLTCDLLGDEPAAAVLRAYWVSDLDIFAAESPEHAQALAENEFGIVLSAEDVGEVSAADLARTLVDEDGTTSGTLAELLAKTEGPGYLMGVE